MNSRSVDSSTRWTRDQWTLQLDELAISELVLFNSMNLQLFNSMNSVKSKYSVNSMKSKCGGREGWCAAGRSGPCLVLVRETVYLVIDAAQMVQRKRLLAAYLELTLEAMCFGLIKAAPTHCGRFVSDFEGVFCLQNTEKLGNS